MNINITETSYESIKSPTLKAIAHSRALSTRVYIAKIGNVEAAIMTVDFYSPPLPLFVYLIFVEETHRRKGIGSKLLDYAERLAIEQGNPSIVLQPHEVERSMPKQKLVDWYERRGFAQRVGDPLRLEKILA